MTADKAIWLVEAQESCDGSGGPVTLLIVTRDAATLPDVRESYRRARDRDSCNLYEISSIRLVGEFGVEGFLLVDWPDWWDSSEDRQRTRALRDLPPRAPG